MPAPRQLPPPSRPRPPPPANGGMPRQTSSSSTLVSDSSQLQIAAVPDDPKRLSTRLQGVPAQLSTPDSNQPSINQPSNSHYRPKYSSYLTCNTRFDLPPRYRLIHPLGSGSFGLVCAAEDLGPHGTTSLGRVAVKKVVVGKQAPGGTWAGIRVAREIKILRWLRGHENIVTLRDLYVRSRAPPQIHSTLPPQPSLVPYFSDVYMVAELMDTDLAAVLRSGQLLSEDQIKWIAYQMLRGIKWIHGAGVVHRDMKPANLLLNSTCDLRICDFGLARSLRRPSPQSSLNAHQYHTSGPSFPLSDYVATRWYRAPEVFYDISASGNYSYSPAADMWSAGCVIAEMVAGKPIFMGTDAANQLDLITDVTGFPQPATVTFVCTKGVHSVRAKARRGSSVFLPRLAGALVADLIDKILSLNPADRLSASDALRHPYFAPLHVEEDEPSAPFFADWKWELEAEAAGEVSEERLRELIYEESKKK